MQRPDPILLGYRPRRPWPTTPEFGMPHVAAVASASDCLTESLTAGAPEWQRINGALHYATVPEAVAAAQRAAAAGTEHPAHADIHATLLFPLIFDGARSHPLALNLRPTAAGLVATATPARMESLGLDIVALGGATTDIATDQPLEWLEFGCAPLSCNLLGRALPVNRSCLLDRWDDAVAAARRFAAEEPEPGPFVIVEVQRVLPPDEP